MRLEGRTILVSGGASGLGAATVEALVASGARAVILDIQEEAGRTLAERLGEAALFLPTDVTSEESVADALARTRERYGPPSGAVACAGIGTPGRILSRKGPHPLDTFRRVIEVNLIGTFNLMRLAAAAIAESDPDEEGERGVIVCTASVAAFEGQIGQAAYSASKGGVVGMTLPAARELARFGIRVVTIAPGIFDTPLMAGLGEDVRRSLEALVPFPPRLGRPAEYAALVRHIFENRMLNGTTLRLDGALRMPPR